MKNMLLCCVLLLTACATNKTLNAVGGSKADATVRLAYNYTLLEDPVIDWGLADATAKRHCQAWGYKQALRFGGQETSCSEHNSDGNCIETRVDVTYQCL